MFNEIVSPVDGLGADWASILAVSPISPVENFLNLQDVVDSISGYSHIPCVAAQMVTEAGLVYILLLAEGTDLGLPGHIAVGAFVLLFIDIEAF